MIAKESSDDYSDVIDTETTFMTQICRNIFNHNASLMPESGSVKRLNCINWFIEAYGQCSKKLLDNSGQHSTLSQLFQYLNLRSFFTTSYDPNTNNYFPEEQQNALISHPHMKIEPSRMTPSDCNHFFLEIAQDYIYVAPKFLLCAEEISYVESSLRALFGLLMIYTFYRAFKYFTIKQKETFQWYVETEEERNLLGKIFYEKKQKSIVNEMLKRSIYESRHLRFYNPHSKIDIKPDELTLVMNINSDRHLQNAITVLVKSPPMWERYKNGVVFDQATSSCSYAAYKINKNLKESSTFRVIIEYNITKPTLKYTNCKDLFVSSKKLNLRNSFVQLETIDECSDSTSKDEKSDSEQIISYETLIENPPVEGGDNVATITTCRIKSRKHDKNDEIDERAKNLIMKSRKKLKSNRISSSCYCKILRKNSPRFYLENKTSTKSMPEFSQTETNRIQTVSTGSDPVFWTVIQPKVNDQKSTQTQSQSVRTPRQRDTTTPCNTPRSSPKSKLANERK